jgi:GNAT superfamily N-acetyltransferase
MRISGSSPSMSMAFCARRATGWSASSSPTTNRPWQWPAFASVTTSPWGHHLYVDDLSTAPQGRRQGHAGALLDWLIEEGRRLGCGQLHLDSGVGPERFDAHRLYHNHGLAIYSHHFARGL